MTRQILLTAAILVLAALRCPAAQTPDLSGTWQVEGHGSSFPWTLSLAVDGTRLTGTVDACAAARGQVSEISGGVLDGTRVRFTCTSLDGNHTVALRGAVSGDTIEFTWSKDVKRGTTAFQEDGMFGGAAPARFTARRVSRALKTDTTSNLIGGGDPSFFNGPVGLAVASAKRAGKTAISFDLFSCPTLGESVPIESMARGRTVWVVTVAPRRPQGVATQGTIYTWTALHITRRLADVMPLDDSECTVPLPTDWPSLRAAETAVATFGGTATVDGIRVTENESEGLFPLARQSYLLIGQRCPDGVLSVERRFSISADGQLLYSPGQPLVPPLTVDELARRLK